MNGKLNAGEAKAGIKWGGVRKGCISFGGGTLYGSFSNRCSCHRLWIDQSEIVDKRNHDSTKQCSMGKYFNK